jgi:phage FluMu protein Com
MDTVRCNYCEKVFYDEQIIVQGDEEQCPYCRHCGCITDLVDHWS